MATAGRELETHPMDSMASARQDAERRAFEALAAGRPDVCCLALMALARRMRRQGDAASAGALEGMADAVAEGVFCAYGDDAAVLEDAGRWWEAVWGEADAQEALNRVMLCLDASRRSGAALRVLGMERRLGFSPQETLWLVALLAYETREVSQRGGVELKGAALERALGGLGVAPLEPSGALVRWGLVHVGSRGSRASLRMSSVALNERAWAWVEGRDGWPCVWDGLLRRWSAKRSAHESLEAQAERWTQVVKRVMAVGEGRGAQVVARGPSLATVRAVLRGVCARLGAPLLEVDVAASVEAGQDAFEESLKDTFREAALRDALVLVQAHRQWAQVGGVKVLERIARAHRALPWPVFFDAGLGEEACLREGLALPYEVKVEPPGFDDQVSMWRRALEGCGRPALEDEVLQRDVVDMALNVEHIERSVALAHQQALVCDVEQGQALEPAVLKEMAARQRVSGLKGIADRVSVKATWRDVVLPAEAIDGLMEIVTYARYKRKVFEQWGFGRRVTYGTSNTALFVGPPGTGKTMCAGLVARELGMDLFRVDLSQVVSKYIGETEKNLSRVFDVAERTHAMLLFDEADSLFGKRTEVSSSHDRNANQEVNHLLQRLERFDGVALLTTNYEENIDEAFMRRVLFKVQFTFPEARDRSKLWRSMLPTQAELDGDIDFVRLGRAFEMSGGHIKNAVLRAAFAAAEAGDAINMARLEMAAVQEYRQMGRLVRLQDDGSVWLPAERRRLRD